MKKTGQNIYHETTASWDTRYESIDDTVERDIFVFCVQFDRGRIRVDAIQPRRHDVECVYGVTGSEIDMDVSTKCRVAQGNSPP